MGALVLVTVNAEQLLRDDEADERDDALSPFEVFEDIEDIEDIEDRAAKKPKRPKKQALPETMETFKALTREEMPWFRLKYLKTLKTEQLLLKHQTEEILTNHTLPEKWSNWENT